VLVAQDAPDPVPAPGEVVVDVAAADVLFVETVIRRGNGLPYFRVRPPYRPGVGVAGVVSDAGDGVDRAWLGRRAVTRTGDHGGYVERALVAAERLIPIPDEVSLADAAALLHDGTTALRLADVVGIKPGERVLVTAAGGGLGVLLVQLAHAAGASVVAAARGTQKLERIRQWGADTVVDYSRPDWIDRVRHATGGLDVVLDGAGGAVGRAAFDLVVPGGRFSAHGTPSGEFATADQAQARARGITATGIEQVQLSADFQRYAERALAEAAAGRLKPLIGQTFPLGKAADAHAAIEARAVIGKTLLIPS
jgi:NADPH:quinone reductase